MITLAFYLLILNHLHRLFTQLKRLPSLSLPRPFTPDLKLISFTNPFLHSHSYSSRTAFTCTELSGHWRLFVLVCSFYIFYILYVFLSTCARLSWSHSALESSIVSYRIVGLFVVKCGLSNTFQFWTKWQTDRQTDRYLNNSHCFQWHVLDDTCRMNRFWSWIQIDPLLTKRKNDCYIFIPSDLDLWPLKRKFALTVTRVSTKCEVCMSFLFRANQTQRTDGHGATLNAASTARAAYHAVVCSVLAGKAYLKAGRRGRRHATVDLVVANMFHRSSF